MNLNLLFVITLQSWKTLGKKVGELRKRVLAYPGGCNKVSWTRKHINKVSLFPAVLESGEPKTKVLVGSVKTLLRGLRSYLYCGYSTAEEKGRDVSRKTLKGL